MLNENIRRFLATGLGLAIFTKDRVVAIVQELVKQGQVSREEGERLLDDILLNAQAQSSELRSSFNEGFSRILERVGLARQDDVEVLKKRIEELERHLNLQQEAEPAEEKTADEGLEEGEAPSSGDPGP